MAAKYGRASLRKHPFIRYNSLKSSAQIGDRIESFKKWNPDRRTNFRHTNKLYSSKKSVSEAFNYICQTFLLTGTTVHSGLQGTTTVNKGSFFTAKNFKNIVQNSHTELELSEVESVNRLVMKKDTIFQLNKFLESWKKVFHNYCLDLFLQYLLQQWVTQWIQKYQFRLYYFLVWYIAFQQLTPIFQVWLKEWKHVLQTEEKWKHLLPYTT